MRTFSSDVLEALSQDIVEYFLLIELYLNDTYYFTTHPYDITTDGKTFSANGSIFEYDSPRQNSVLDREAYKIQLIDPSYQLFNELRTGVVNKKVTIRAGFIHKTKGLLKEPSDLVYVYKGYVDAPKVTSDFDSKIVELDCSSPMADFDMVRPFWTTSYGIAQYDDEDTSFDRINEGYEMQISWGKV